MTVIIGFIYLIGSGISVGGTALHMLGMAFSETIGLVGRPSLEVEYLPDRPPVKERYKENTELSAYFLLRLE